MRKRLRHLSFKSTAVRCSMAGKPSFLMSAHLPPPHCATPRTRASASSSAHGLWCLLRLPVPFSPGLPRPAAALLAALRAFAYLPTSPSIDSASLTLFAFFPALFGKTASAPRLPLASVLPLAAAAAFAAAPRRVGDSCSST
jgi:hypothetical protein